MKIWVDAQLSPRIARWISANFPVVAEALRDIGLRDATDERIFSDAGTAGAIVLTKDSDFIRLLELRGSPPKVIWLTCGNTSDAALQQILLQHLSTARCGFWMKERILWRLACRNRATEDSQSGARGRQTQRAAEFGFKD
jgi:predicted nuclease of predicted toxin-antitoxin system